MKDHARDVETLAPTTPEESQSLVDDGEDLCLVPVRKTVSIRNKCVLNTEWGRMVMDRHPWMVVSMMVVWMLVMSASIFFHAEVPISRELQDHASCTRGYKRQPCGEGEDCRVMFIRNFELSWIAMLLSLVILWFEMHFLNVQLVQRLLLTFDTMGIVIGMTRYEVASNFTGWQCGQGHVELILNIIPRSIMAIVGVFALSTVDAMLPRFRATGNMLLLTGTAYGLGMLIIMRCASVEDGFWPLDQDFHMWLTPSTPRFHAISGMSTMFIFVLKATVLRLVFKFEFVSIRENYEWGHRQE